jgi:hypothetical protein
VTRGMFRTSEGRVQVDHDGSTIPIPRSKYEENGYQPEFDKLPLEANYWTVQEKVESRRRRSLLSDQSHHPALNHLSIMAVV